MPLFYRRLLVILLVGVSVFGLVIYNLYALNTVLREQPNITHSLNKTNTTLLNLKKAKLELENTTTTTFSKKQLKEHKDDLLTVNQNIVEREALIFSFQQKLNENRQNATKLIAITLSCVGLTGLLLAWYNYGLKYHRAFTYVVTESTPTIELSATLDTGKGVKLEYETDIKVKPNKELRHNKRLVIINQRDKTETLLSAYLKGLFGEIVEIHSIMDEPKTLPAFGHIVFDFETKEKTKTYNHHKYYSLVIHTGEGREHKGKPIPRWSKSAEIIR